MTGRYHIHTGLNYVIAASNPAGLMEGHITLPAFLKSNGYRTAMVGKWHLGSARGKQTPTGKGFDDFIGMYSWGADAYTKQIHGAPWAAPLLIDWVRESSNSNNRTTFSHYAEPLHSTEAIRQGAIDLIDQWAEGEGREPLFLFVAFTAAHSPLQPLPQHAAACAHIAHPWRSAFCGLVVGADEAVGSIIKHALRELGTDTLTVLTSDNGASPWFGGSNYPLRGTKATSLQGGVRVPALIVDHSKDQRYLGGADAVGREEGAEGQRVYNGLMHVSDWFPTLASFAGLRHPAGLDGLDLSAHLAATPITSNSTPLSHYLSSSFGYTSSPRKEVLLESISADGSLWGAGELSYRQGDLKVIQGQVRDPHSYFDAKSAMLVSDDPHPLARRAVETLCRIGDAVFGVSAFDALRTYMVYGPLHSLYSRRQRVSEGLGFQEVTRLFNLSADPLEAHDLSSEPWALHTVQQLLAAAEETQARGGEEVPIQRTFLTLPAEHWAEDGLLIPGDCSRDPTIRPEHCLFLHPWVRDNGDGADPWADPRLLPATAYLEQRLLSSAMQVGVALAAGIFLLGLLIVWRRAARGADGGNRRYTHQTAMALAAD